MQRIRYSYSRVGATRRHYLTAEDVHVLLSRLPMETWSRLRAVHFNDRGRGCRVVGYVNMGHREIAICALPIRTSLTRFQVGRATTKYCLHRSSRTFGAIRGQQWTELAIRRYLLYNTFLHELGHLQMVDAKAKRLKRRFAGEAKAQEFADYWRTKLWLRHFDQNDPVHNPPTASELDDLKCVANRQADQQPAA